MQKMFNIFEEADESISKQAKVRLLLAQLDGITLTECAKPLSAIVSELPDHQACKISAAESMIRPQHSQGGGADGGLPSKRKGIHMPDGRIWTAYSSDWDKMFNGDKQKVMDTRKKNKDRKSVV